MDVKRTQLHNPLCLICKEYPGEIQKTREFLDDVYQRIKASNIYVRPNHSVSVFFEEEDRSWQGAVTDEEGQHLPEDLFELEMPDANYLTVAFQGSPVESIPKAMEQLDKVAKREDLNRGPRTYILAEEKNGTTTFSVMQRILLSST